jgi:hypothetical protein
VKRRVKPLRTIRLGVESLEDRMLLSVAPTAGFDPTPLEQELLEHLNRMRLDPQGELYALFTSLDPLVAQDPEANLSIDRFRDPTSQEILTDWASLSPVAPLAWNESLHAAALEHSALMIDLDSQSHQLPGEPTLGNRVEAAGYEGWSRVGENIYAYANSPFHAHSAFAIDWGVPDRGHRQNMMDPGFQDVGVGILVDFNSGTDAGPLVVTQDFGYRSGQSESFLLGAVYDDADQDGWYDAGEGLGGVTVEIQGTEGPVTTLSMTAGSYQMRVPDGVYTLRAYGGPLASPIEITDVVVAGENVKVDFLGSSQPNQPPSVDLNGPGAPGTGYSASFSAGAGSVPIVGPGLTVHDSDSQKLVSATATIVNLLDPGAELLLVDAGSTGIAAYYDPLSGVLSLTGSESREDYQQVLGTLRYDNTAFEPVTAARSVTVTVNDGFVSSVPAVATVNFSPDLSIDALVLTEGDYGQSNLVFTVSLSHGYEQPVEVDYAVGGGTAQPGIDYQLQGGRIRFEPGQTGTTINATILGDTAVEEDETFYVTLSNPSNARIANAQAQGLIVDDDSSVELAPIELARLTQLDPSNGRILYQVQASQQGLLTFDASFQGPEDALRMILYDGSRSEQPLAVAISEAGSGRIDWQADAGAVYFLSLSGSTQSVDLALANLVTQDGPAVSVRGTDGDDHFELDASEGLRITIDGVDYQFEAATVETVTFDAGEGSDTVVLRDSEHDDTLVAGPGWLTFSGGNLSVEAAGFETLYAYAGAGGTDTASLYDSPANDKFKAYPDYAKLYGGGSYSRVKYFDSVHAYATDEGVDKAFFYDSPQPDKFKATPVYAKMYNGAYQNRAKFFEMATAYGTPGGGDAARLFDSPGDDHALATPEKAWIGGGQVPFEITARCFGDVTFYASEGGHDVAELYDDVGDDVFRGLSHKSELFDAATEGDAHRLLFRQFEEVRAYAANGGVDTARLYRPAGSGLIEVGEGWTRLSETGFSIEVVGFEVVEQEVSLVDTILLLGE